MKSYKSKSLIYLSAFVLSAFFYHKYEENLFQEQLLNSKVAENKFEDQADTIEKEKEADKEAPKEND